MTDEPMTDETTRAARRAAQKIGRIFHLPAGHDLTEIVEVVKEAANEAIAAERQRCVQILVDGRNELLKGAEEERNNAAQGGMVLVAECLEGWINALRIKQL